MKKSILISALLLCIAPSVFGQEDELKTIAEIKSEKDKKPTINKKEAKRILKEEKEREKAQDILHIKNDIKEKFLEWAKKGEFESSKEHIERIQNERAKKLYQVITDGFAGRMDGKTIEISLGEYNADEKIYPITINITPFYNHPFSSFINYKISVKEKIPFERGEEAIEFQRSIKSRDYNFLKEYLNNWFVKDGFLFPIEMQYGYEDRLIKISDKGNYPLFLEYVFNTNDLGLSEYFPENYTFTLKDVIQEEKLKAAELKAAKEEAERIRKEEKQRENAKDIPHIKNYIKKGFLEWAKKGEFESSKEHFERIQSERVKKLHQLTAYEFENRAKPMIHIKLGEYNADEKIYPITIELTFYPPSSHSYSISVEKNIPLEREEAANLKNYIFDNKFAAIEYRLEKDPNNWFVKDGFLFPINLEYREGILKNIFDKENYPLFSEYVFNTDDLGLSEYFPENYTFTLKDYIIEKKAEK